MPSCPICFSIAINQSQFFLLISALFIKPEQITAKFSDKKLEPWKKIVPLQIIHKTFLQNTIDHTKCNLLLQNDFTF